MTSLDIISFKKNIEDYCKTSGLPYEVIRLVFKEMYESISKQALNEAYQQAKEQENGADS